jgi:YfiH family protein
MKLECISPDWPAPANVHAYTTTRVGGVSASPYHSFNLAAHVNDAPAAVEKNRRLLRDELQLPSEPLWLQQVHSTLAVNSDEHYPGIEVDAVYTQRANAVCAVLTADCVPLLVCDRLGKEVAAIHAGWRGLLAGVIEKTVQAMRTPSNQLLVWLGPAIGPKVFTVGENIREQFIAEQASAESAFQLGADKQWRADLYELARQRLHREGVSAVYGGEYCTYSDAKRFYSYRRDEGITGRMATLIWFSE